MNKKLRLVAVAVTTVLLVLVVSLAILPGPVEAQGGGDGASVMGTNIFDVDFQTAVNLAAATPDEWSYDPADRTIHPEENDLSYPVQLSEREWQRFLDPHEYYILRQKGTEPAFTHPLNENEERGIYYSAATGQPLFHSDDKYDSLTGWPSFTRPINPHAIVYVEDNSFFMRRVEVVDSLSGSHLGHVFPDGPAPTNQRYCINGAALIFVPEGEAPPQIRTTASAP